MDSDLGSPSGGGGAAGRCQSSQVLWEKRGEHWLLPVPAAVHKPVSSLQCPFRVQISGFRARPHVGRRNGLGKRVCLLWPPSGPGSWVARATGLARQLPSVPAGLARALPLQASLDRVSCLRVAPLGPPVAPPFSTCTWEVTIPPQGGPGSGAHHPLWAGAIRTLDSCDVVRCFPSTEPGPLRPFAQAPPLGLCT